MARRLRMGALRLICGLGALLPASLVGGCDALWGGYLAYRGCDAPGGCPPGETCNTSVGRCEPIPVDAGTPETASASPGVCVLANLCWENPLPQGNDLTAVSARTPTDVWAVGQTRTVLHYDGLSWVQAIPPSQIANDHLYGVFAFSATDVWVVGQGGMLFSKSGASWVDAKPVGAGDLLSVWALASKSGLAVGDMHSVYGCSGCAAWSPLNPMTVGYLRGVWAANATNAWVVGDGGQILKAGTTGTPAAETSNTTSQLNSVWGSSTTDVLAVGRSGATVRRQGSTVWSKLNAGTNDHLSGLWGDGTRFWTTALHSSGDGQIYRLESGTWVAASGLLPSLTGLAGNAAPGAPDIWAVGVNGTLVQGNGTTWTVKSSGIVDNLLTVWGSSETDIWAGGQKGTLLHFDGNTWTSVLPPTSDDITALHGTGKGNVWLTTGTGAILQYDGNAWHGTFMSGYALQTVRAVSDADVWAAGDAAGAGIILRNTGAGWVVADSPAQPVSVMWAGAPDNVWAFGSTGVVRKWNGTAWSTGPTPGAGLQISAAVGLSSTQLFVGAASGAIYEGDGSGWTLVSDDTQRAVNAIAGNAANRMLVVGAGQKGAVGYLGRRGETTWSALPTVTHKQLRSAWVSPNGRIWVVGNGGTILRYTP